MVLALMLKFGDIVLCDCKEGPRKRRNWVVGIILEISGGSCIIDVYESCGWPGTKYLLAYTETPYLNFIGSVTSIFPENQAESYLNERLKSYQEYISREIDAISTDTFV